MSEGFHVPQCECGHAIGDHRSSGSGALFPRRYGVCRREGCECREFREVTEDREAA